MSTLHGDIAKIASEKGAMVLEFRLLDNVVLSEFKRSAGKLVGVSLDTGHAAVEAVFDAISTPASSFQLDPWANADQFTLVSTIKVDFKFTIRLACVSNPKLTFCRVHYAVDSLAVTMNGEVQNLTFEFSFNDIKPLFETDDSERDAAIAASGIDDKDLLRLEGVFAYGMGNRLLRSALGKPQIIELQKLFPAISFSGKLELHSVQSNILVIPEQMSIAGATGCSPINPLDGAEISVGKPGPDGQFSLHGVVPAARRPAAHADPVVALYAPKFLLEQRFEGETSPAIAHEDVGTGFIGHVLHITAAVKGVRVTIESGALDLTLSFAVWGGATVNVDVPCIGRSDFGRVDVRIPDNGNADLTVTLRGGMDTSLRAILTSELKGLNLGTPYVNFSLFGGLKPSLVATVTSYIVDHIIGVVVRNNLNWMIFDALKKALEDKFFVIADLGQFATLLEQLPNSATHSGETSSALMGCQYIG